MVLCIFPTRGSQFGEHTQNIEGRRCGFVVNKQRLITHPCIVAKVGEGVLCEVDLAHDVHAAATLDVHGTRDRLGDR